MLAIGLATLLILLPTTRGLVNLALNDQRYSHLVFAPVFCILLIHWRREEMLRSARYSPRFGAALLGSFVLLGVIVNLFQGASNDPARLFSSVLLMVLSWIAGFILCYGFQSFRNAIYPLACLLLAIPIPMAWMDWTTSILQQGTAAVTYSILETFGVSVFRTGTNFSIPGLNFNIAPECSGIHSWQVFLIIGILCAHVFLRRVGSRVALLAATVPIAIFKNAVRVVVITLLAANVDRSFIDGPFHHKYGGVIFAPLDILVFVPLVVALRRIELWWPIRSGENTAKPMTASSGVSDSGQLTAQQ
jgi:exosortase